MDRQNRQTWIAATAVILTVVGTTWWTGRRMITREDVDDLRTEISCSDVEQPANALIAHFGNLRGILDAPIEELRAARRIGSVTPIALQIIRAAATLYLQQGREAP